MPSRTDKLIQRHPELEKVRGDLEGLESESDRLDKENAGLRERIQGLEETHRKLELELTSLKAAEAGFVRSHGVLWKMGANGLAEPAVYCPACKLVMTPLPSGNPEYFICTECRFRADIDPNSIHDVAASVNA